MMHIVTLNPNVEFVTIKLNVEVGLCYNQATCWGSSLLQSKLILKMVSFTIKPNVEDHLCYNQV